MIGFNFNANFSSVESGLRNVAGLFRSVREQFRREPLRFTNPKEFQDFRKEFEDLAGKAKSFHNLKSDQFSSLHQKPAESLMKDFNAWVQRHGGGVRYRLNQQLNDHGATPFSLDFAQLYPHLKGQALAERAQSYYGHVFGRTGIAAPDIHPAAPGWMARMGQLGQKALLGTAGGYMAGGISGAITGLSGSLGGALGGPAGAVLGTSLGLAASGLIKGYHEATEIQRGSEHFLRRSTEIGDALADVKEHLSHFGKGLWLTGHEMVKVASVYADAANEGSAYLASKGARDAAGFARAYGMDPNQSAHLFGRAKALGQFGTDTERRQFALQIGQAIHTSGTYTSPEKIFGDLLQHIERLGGATGRYDNSQTEAFLSWRSTAQSSSKAMGDHAASILSGLNHSLLNPGASMQGEAFIQAAIRQYQPNLNLYQIQRLRERGVLSEVAPGKTILDAEIERASASARGNADLRDAILHDVNPSIGLNQWTELVKINDLIKQQGHPGAETIRRALDGKRVETMDAGALKSIYQAATGTREDLGKLLDQYHESLNPQQRERLTEASKGDLENFRAVLIQVLAEAGVGKTSESVFQEGAANITNKLADVATPLVELRDVTVGTIAPVLEAILDGLGKLGDTWMGQKLGMKSSEELREARFRNAHPEYAEQAKKHDEAVKNLKDLEENNGALQKRLRDIKSEHYSPVFDKYLNGVDAKQHQALQDKKLSEVNNALDSNSEAITQAQHAERATQAAMEAAREHAENAQNPRQAPEQAQGQRSDIQVPKTPTVPNRPLSQKTVQQVRQYESLIPNSPQKLGLDIPQTDWNATMMALFGTESSGDPNSINPISGATGLGQVLSSTGTRPGYGVEPLADADRTDPAKNARFSSDYLAALTKRYGSLKSGLAHYGEGDAYADKVLSRIPQFSGANQAAVPAQVQAPPPTPAQVQAPVPAPDSMGSPLSSLNIQSLGEMTVHHVNQKGERMNSEIVKLKNLVSSGGGARGGGTLGIRMPSWGQSGGNTESGMAAAGVS